METICSLVGVWGAIANKIEASQETCFLFVCLLLFFFLGGGQKKITQASVQINKWYVQYILNFLKAFKNR